MSSEQRAAAKRFAIEKEKYDKQIEQLRREASVNRMKVSDSTQNLVNYCLIHENNDALVSGFGYTRPNPFDDEETRSLRWLLIRFTINILSKNVLFYLIVLFVLITIFLFLF